MPRIENPRAQESRFIHWIKRDLNQGLSNNRSIKPKYPTSDPFALTYGRLPYRNYVDLAQIYSSESRHDYVGHLNTTVKQLSCENTVQLRWRVSKEVPAFSLDFLQLYLSRFGPVEAIYQLANNVALVTFKNVQSSRFVLSSIDLGLPYGRLHAKRWNPTNMDPDYFRVIKHVHKASETKSRFHSLMDKDDRLSVFSNFRNMSRNICTSSKKYGQTLSRLFNQELQVTDILSEKKTSLPSKKSTLVMIKNAEDYFATIKKMGTLVVVDFYATWCGPCKKIAPFLDMLVTKINNVLVAKVNVDECADLADEEDIKSLPTFIFYKNGTKLETLIGASEEKLLELVVFHSQ
ncbi:disulfide-isomerase C1F5.02 [Biomphalaria glabrata]|nr:disulfide-isomerase C1F5.02 [Biomphalaria glabrata]